MKKGSVFGIVCACLALALLAGVAIFVTYQAGDTLNNETSSAVQQADELLDALQPVTESPETAKKETSEEKAEEKSKEEKTKDEKAKKETEAPAVKASYIWVGDSRTVGMHDAMNNDDIYIAASGEGYDWFMAEGLKELTKVLEQNPELPVVFNFGVNDYSNMNSYMNVYKALEQDHTASTFYYLTVYPVDEEVCRYTNNEEIQDFNAHLKERFGDRCLDSYKYLVDHHVETVDGIHYSHDTYRALYKFATDKIGKIG